MITIFKILLIGWTITLLFVLNLTIQYFYNEYKNKKK